MSEGDDIKAAEFRGRVSAQLEALNHRCDGLHRGVEKLREGVAELEKWRWKVVGIAAGLGFLVPILIDALKNALASGR